MYHNPPEHAVSAQSRFPDLSRVLAALASVPHARYLGISCDEIGRGRAILRMPYPNRLIGDYKTAVIHGAITTLLDTLSWLVASSMVSEKTAIATLDLRIDYLRPATPLEPILAAGECYRLTSSVAFTRGVAYHDRREEPIAHLTGTCMLGSTGFSTAGGEPAPAPASVA